MKNNSICKVQIDGVWVTVPAEITILPLKKMCTYHIKGCIDCEIPEEYIYSKLVENIDAFAPLRETEELTGQMTYDDFLLDDRE